MTEPEAKQHVDQIRQERFWLDDSTRKPNQNPLLGMLRRALNQLATGIFEHAHHYVFELIQNADDNNYPTDAERFLKIVLLETDPTDTSNSRGCLCILNDERGFERTNVESLCDIGNSTKHNREGYIGEKGIGFKSVFLISDRPHIISNGYRFHFRLNDCDAGLGYIVPHWVNEIPPIAQAGGTAILLPLRSAANVDVAKQLADIEPECVLFLRKLRRIELVSDSSKLNRVVRCTGTEGHVRLDADGKQVSYFIHRAEHPCAHIQEPLRDGVKSTWVTVALPLTAPDAADGRIFAYLPTETRTGFPFLINADFLLPSSREHIFDTPEWNKQLVTFAAATFVDAFDKLRSEDIGRTAAYRFVPTLSDLLRGTGLFAPLIQAVQTALKQKECVLTDDGNYVAPGNAYFASSLARKLLADSPPNVGIFHLVHPDLEQYKKRLEPLGVQPLKVSQLLQICSDTEWLKDRKAEWWETLFDLLSSSKIGADAIASFPLLRCQDGVCRRPCEKNVFIQAEGQQPLLTLSAEWPAAHILGIEIQNKLQKNPAAWAWLTQTAGLQPFSIQAYITGNLLDWMRTQTNEIAANELIEATRFIAANLKQPEAHRQILREKLPWLLADDRVLLPSGRTGKELVMPECTEGDLGWNWVFISEQDRQHFWLLSDAYLQGETDANKESIRNLMVEAGATNLPDPPKLAGSNGIIDWSGPRWLRDLNLQQPPQNLEKKISALEHWIGRFKVDYFARFLISGVQESEFGLALRNRPWLHSSKGLVAPSGTFIDDPEIRAFLRDSVAYTPSKLPSELLEKMGVRLRLSATTLIDLLRRMRDSSKADEELIVRIYKRLQTLEFNTETFRTEPLIFLSIPSATWRQTEQVFWEDAGDVFDDYFGYAMLTYGNDELHGFFTAKLGVGQEIPEQQLAEVWAKMSTMEDVPAPELVQKRLGMILPKLASAIEPNEPPDWWPLLRPRMKVWTTAKRFEAPTSAFAPDDTFAEETFSKIDTIRIAWVPKSHLTIRLNRFLRALGCLSLTKSLRSRAVNALPLVASNKSKFLTVATKELLIYWVCAENDWERKREQLEQLLYSNEGEVRDIRVEYWLEGENTSVSNLEADAFWARQDQWLCLRQTTTAKAQQSAAATSIASQLGRHGKQNEDTVYRLLGLEAADAIREIAERKWELTPEQKSWLQSLGHKAQLVEIIPETANKTREARPATTQNKTPDGIAPVAPAPPTMTPPADEKASSDTPSPLPPSAPSGPGSNAPQLDGAETVNQTGESQNQKRDGAEHHTPAEGADTGTTHPLKSPDADTEFVHVAAHTRSRPREKRRERVTGIGGSREQHPMAGVPASKKAELEEMAVQIIKRQFQQNPGLRSFNLHDERKQNHGYDLLAIKSHEVIRIEIKAHLREAKSVFVTQKEWQQSKQRNNLATNDRWELWNVENIAADAGKVRITRYSYLPDEARTRESGYWVDLSLCSSQSVQ